MQPYRPNLYLDVASHGITQRQAAQGWMPRPRTVQWLAISIYTLTLLVALSALIWGG